MRNKRLILRVALSLTLITLLLANTTPLRLPGEQASASPQALHDLQGHRPAPQFDDPPTGIITGHVHDADSDPIADVNVSAYPYGDGEGGGDTLSDASGCYTLTVEVGTYRIVANKDWYVTGYYSDTLRWEDAAEVEVLENETTPDTDFSLDLAGRITGTVLNPDDQAVDHARVMVHDESHQFHTDTWSDESGHFALYVPPDTPYLLGVEPPGDSQWAAPEEIEVDAPTAEETLSVGDVYLARPLVIGQVKDPGGTTPIQGSRVEVHSEDWFIRQEANTDQDGYFRIGGLPDGIYTLEAQAPNQGEGSQYSDSVPQAVEVTAGSPNDVGAVLLTNPQISGQVTLPDGTTPVPHAWVEARSMDGMTHKGSSADEEGRFTIGGLLQGTYYLRAQPPGGPDGEDYTDYSASAEEEVIVGSEPIIQNLALQRVSAFGRVVDPEGNPVCCTGVDIHTEDHSFHEGTGTGDDGRFAFGGLEPRNYVVEVHAPWGMSGWISPDPRSFTVPESGDPVNLGDIAFLEADKFIRGVVQDESGLGVPRVEVNAWQKDGMAWANTRTNEDGGFSIGVAGESWEVMIHPAGDGEADWVYNGHPQRVTFAEGETTKEITFIVQSADAHVIGRVLGPNGEQLAPWSVHVDVRNHQGIGNGAPVREDGTFDVAVTAGTYDVWLHVDERQYPTWGSPEINPITVGEGETDLRTLNLVAKNCFITGQVSRDSDGRGVAGVDVNAWRPMAGGWAHTTTAADGSYSLAVISGTWEIGIHVPFTSTYISGLPPQRVSVDEDETVPDVDFVLQEASGSIEGLVVDEQDNVLTDLYGWAYARQGMGPPVAGAPVEGGRFTINVPSGSYWVGVGLPPESNYTPTGEEPITISQLRARVAALDTPQAVAAAYREHTEQQVTVTMGDPVQVVHITVVPNNAHIVGRFRKTDGSPATDLQGEVFAMSGMGGAWRSTMINPDGTYDLHVAAGTWNLGYWLMNEEYVNSPPPESRVTVEAEDTFTMNFTLVAADSLIKGYLKLPDGSGLDHGWAWAHRERTETSARIDTGSDSQPPEGYFEINVPAGEYEVGGCAPPEERGYVQPEMQQVTVSPSSPANVTLQFRESDGVIRGKVFQDGDPVPDAWVWGWSEGGAHTGASTYPDGHYELDVITGTVWHLGASYRHDDAMFYDTMQDYVVDMTGPTATQDMELSLNEIELPDAVTVHFDASSPILISLDDGTEINIPAGALGITGTIKLVISPIVEDLANTLTARPFGYGYSIHAFDSSNRQINSTFNQNVTISFYYTEDDLNRRGVSEDDLSPAYFSTTTNSWTKVESFTVDTENNRITAQINHFSVWAMTSGQGGNFEVFLPGVMHNYDHVSAGGSRVSLPRTMHGRR